MYDEQGKRPTISLMFGRRYTVNGHKLENIFDGNVSFFYSRSSPTIHGRDLAFPYWRKFINRLAMAQRRESRAKFI